MPGALSVHVVVVVGLGLEGGRHPLIGDDPIPPTRLLARGAVVELRYVHPDANRFLGAVRNERSVILPRTARRNLSRWPGLVDERTGVADDAPVPLGVEP